MTRQKKYSIISVQSAEILKNPGRTNVASVVFKGINLSSINMLFPNRKGVIIGLLTLLKRVHFLIIPINF